MPVLAISNSSPSIHAVCQGLSHSRSQAHVQRAASPNRYSSVCGPDRFGSPSRYSSVSRSHRFGSPIRYRSPGRPHGFGSMLANVGVTASPRAPQWQQCDKFSVAETPMRSTSWTVAHSSGTSKPSIARMPFCSRTVAELIPSDAQWEKITCQFTRKSETLEKDQPSVPRYTSNTAALSASQAVAHEPAPSVPIPKTLHHKSGKAISSIASLQRSSSEPRLVSKTPASSKTPLLNDLGRNLTQMAAQGELDPLIGREEELVQMIQVLARRRKNNPMLIGEPGVGKTAVVEGFAQKIANGDLPEIGRDKRIVQIDVASLLAGTKNRGQFEERMKAVIDEVIASNKQIILFIDEIHTIVGAGRSGNASCDVDAAAILKPVLSRGDIQCIGATTLEEYRVHFEKDSSLERRFQPITVHPTSIDETVLILKGLAHKYEVHHKVQYSEEALIACAKLAAEYILDRSMPDKAIDAFDEVGAFVQLQQKAPQGKSTEPDHVMDARHRLEQIQQEKELAVKVENYTLAAQLRQREMFLLTKIQNTLGSMKNSPDDRTPVVVTGDDVARTISKITGIPLEKLSEDESMRMLNLEEMLHQRIVGQDHAVAAVSKALRRARVGLKSPNRPIASFLFCGPTGVGKTELCKALSEAYFGKENAMIRLDMSEFMEMHSISKLIGSPPGYIGYGSENQLTDRIRRKPYSLILFDEIEKAHSDVLNLMLQMMDDGCLTDATGRTVSFKNALIIMTSNVCHHSIELRQTFSPEFLNRIDGIIPFSPLGKHDVENIAELELAKTIERVKEKGACLTLSEAFKDKVIDHGFDAAYGARALRRSVVKLLDDELADSLLAQPFSDGEHVHVDVGDGQEVLVLRGEENEATNSDSERSKDSEPSPEFSPDASLLEGVLEGDAHADTDSTRDSETSEKVALSDSVAALWDLTIPLSESCSSGILKPSRQQWTPRMEKQIQSSMLEGQRQNKVC